ncbi:MAG: diguanylate cyclase [Methylococcaceae bacterium]|nr:diguanylate cyclase [Methylococcaceae bacterium]
MNVFKKSAPERIIKLDEVILQLTQLFNVFVIPPAFEPQVLHLKSQLQSNPSADLFKAIVNNYIQLLADIKKHLHLEQQETSQLLSSLSEQFTELGLKASGASYAAQLSAQQRNLLDESVSTQMSDLQKKSSEATTLDTLKQLVTTRLVNIRNEIQVHLINQEQQRQETEKQLHELTLKLKALDAESTELKLKLSIAYNKASRDTLTNLPNRRAYEEAISIEIARWQRYQSPLSLAIWDIDLFKKINDTYGHKAGDHTLVHIATLLPQHCRKTDFIARFGGEEFVMLLPNTTEQSALILANKIRKLIEQSSISASDEKISITISCGISQFHANDTEERVFERADKALYHAKANGRNQCIIAE